MASEFNYVVNVDTSRVMGAMAEVRSQVGMAFGAPGTAGGAIGAAPAPTAGAMVVGAAAAGYRIMQAGFNQGMDALTGYSRTHTSPAIAYSPHFGMIQATTNLAQERQIAEGGLAAAARMRPPGVSPFEYAMGVHTNAIERQVEGGYQAFAAGRATAASTAGGMFAGEAAWLLAGAPIGKRIGAKLGARWGLGATAGRAVGGIAGGLLAYTLADEYVGGRIRDHYAKVEQTRGTVTELGDIVGAGRGMTRTERVNLGIAAFDAAKDLNMNVNQMGDVLALGRQTGLLPETTNPAEARQKFRELARAVDEGAQMLHSSLGKAASVISGMAKRGFSAEEGVLQYIGEQATPGLAQMRAFGAEGAAVARANFLRGKQGFDLFTGGVRAAAGADVDPEVLRMMGGKFGAGRMIAQTQMAAALSPMGDLQLMAAQTGGALGGYGDLASAALGAAGEGGDFIGNMLRFDATKDQIRRGIGSKGIRTMAMQQINMQADMLMDIAPSLTRRQAQVSAAMQLHDMTGDQARMYVQGGMRGGGGGAGGISGYGRAAQMEAYQTLLLGRAGISGLETSGGGYEGFKGKNILYGAGGGFMVGGPKGAIVGAIGAAGYEGYKFAKSNWDYLWDSDAPSIWSSAETKGKYEAQRNAARIDAEVAEIERRYGKIPINREVAARVHSAPLSSVQLNVDQFGPAAASRLAGIAEVTGMSAGMGGPGTTLVGGGFYGTRELRTRAEMLTQPEKMDEKTEALAYSIVTSDEWQQKKAGIKPGDAWTTREHYQRSWDRIARGEAVKGDYAAVGQGNEQMLAALKKVDTKESRRLQNLIKEHGFASPEVRGLSHLVFGGERWQRKKMQASLMAGISFQGAMNAEEKDMQSDLENWMGVLGGGASMTGARDKPGAEELTEEEWAGLYEMRSSWMKDESFTDWKKDILSGQKGIWGHTGAKTGMPIEGRRATGTDWKGANEFERGPYRELEKVTYESPVFALAAREKLAWGGKKTKYDKYVIRQNLESALGVVAGDDDVMMRRRRDYLMSGRTGRDVLRPVDPAFMRGLAQDRGFVQALAEGDRTRAEKAIRSHILDTGQSSVKIEDVMAHLDRKVAPIEIDGRHQPKLQAIVTAYESSSKGIELIAGLAEKFGGTSAAEGIRAANQSGQLAKAYREATTPVNAWTEGSFLKKILMDLGTTPGSKVGGKRRRRYRRRQGTERAVGFGQRESAMATINRSLRRTHSMLSTLEKRISKLPVPSGGSAEGPRAIQPGPLGFDQ